MRKVVVAFVWELTLLSICADLIWTSGTGWQAGGVGGGGESAEQVRRSADEGLQVETWAGRERQVGMCQVFTVRYFMMTDLIP